MYKENNVGNLENEGVFKKINMILLFCMIESGIC